MLSDESVFELLAEHYGARPIALGNLQNYSFDWRGIYRADYADGSAWVVRLVRQPDAAADLAGTAALLDWLGSRGYPAPRPIATVNGAYVAQADGWAIQAITYIAGAQPQTHPSDLRAIGAALGRLHALALPDASTAPAQPDSQWPRGTIAKLRQQLQASAPRWPDDLRPIQSRLAASLDALAELVALPTCIIHGDCWPLNAVWTPDRGMVLIDWDGAGYGPAMLDLGKLLLAAHYDLERPLEVEPRPAAVAAVLEGYAEQRPLVGAELALLPAAVPFWLAYSAADYAEATAVLTAEDLFFQKLRVRLAAADGIAELVRR
jgi:Ser/Thr protein kinase RdoA (MazF antagonist)